VTSDLACLASKCPLVIHARKLAAWVGDGRPVTAKSVLRPADVRVVAAVLGVEVPAHVRTAADVEAIHRPWVVAQAMGLLRVEGGQVVAGDAVEGSPIELWLAGLDAVLRAESHDRRQRGAAVLIEVVLTVLAAEPSPARNELEDVVYHHLHAYDIEDAAAAYEAFRRGVMPVDAATAVLIEFGAVDDGMRLTPLGHWALGQIRNRVPRPVTVDQPAGELLAQLSPLSAEDAWRQAGKWLVGRPAMDAATQLLRAAACGSPVQRVTAVDLVVGLGDDALPAWRSALGEPMLAPHAHAVLGDWDQSPDERQRLWLIAEHGLATLAKTGAEDAYHYVQDHGGIDVVERGGHPDIGDLRDALHNFAAAGGGRVRIYQLKITLSRVRPPVWRRVLVPAGATLGVLHQVIQVVMDWDDDHLHAFTANGSRYSDPFYGLEEHGDEDAVRLFRVLPRERSAMSYVYDFGDWWVHEITLEKVLDPEHTRTYPTCVAGRGEAPVEDWNPEFAEEPSPFDADELNRRLAGLASNVGTGDPQLRRQDDQK
jgi:hypothetical protein